MKYQFERLSRNLILSKRVSSKSKVSGITSFYMIRLDGHLSELSADTKVLSTLSKIAIFTYSHFSQKKTLMQFLQKDSIIREITAHLNFYYIVIKTELSQISR